MRGLQRTAILAAAVTLVVSTVACDGANASNNAGILAPSANAASATVAPASKGGGKGKPTNGSSTLALAMVTDGNDNGLPNWGDSITFNVTTTVTTDPQVSVSCSQNGVVVYSALWPLTPVLTLSSNFWQSGQADCTATLYSLSGTTATDLASINFIAYQ